MKQHPDGQPRRAVSVNGGDDDDRCRNQNFKSKGIQGGLILMQNDARCEFPAKQNRERSRSAATGSALNATNKQNLRARSLSVFNLGPRPKNDPQITRTTERHETG